MLTPLIFSAALASASPCLILGDSIAVGLGAQFSGCTVNAKVGIGSAAILARAPRGYLGVTVISAGSNDPHNPLLWQNLRALRERLAGPVIWILPRNYTAAAMVKMTAAIHGDAMVAFAPAKDGVHPKSYRALAGAVRSAWK